MSVPSAAKVGSEAARSFLQRADRPPILYVIQYEEFGGAELMLIPVMERDSNPLLACPPGSPVDELARSRGIPTIALPFRPLRVSGGPLEAARSLFRGLATARDLRRLLRAHPERTLVYCAAVRPGMIAALAALRLGRRVIWSIPEFMRPAPVRQLTRTLARLGCDRAVAISRGVAADFTGRSRMLQRRTRIVHAGTELDRFEALESDAGRPRAAIVGHISPTKRTAAAIEIAAKVGAAEPSFELVIIGQAQFTEENRAYDQALRERVARDGWLRDHVRFAGQRSDVAVELSSCGLLLHCREVEPFGIVLLEAMAAGLPIVAPAAAGPLEIVDHERTGLLYQPGDTDQAAEHVIRLLRDPELASRMGAAGRARARARFSIDVQIAGTERVLEELAPR